MIWPPWTFPGIRKSLFPTRARWRESWWTVVRSNLPQARTADFLAAVRDCKHHVIFKWPEVSQIFLVWKCLGHLGEVLFKCSTRGSDASLKERNHPVRSSPPYLFPATDDHNIVNRIFKLYFPMISNNLFPQRHSNLDNLESFLR